MAFFDKLGNTLSTASKDGINKAKEIKNTTKLTMDIKEREGAIQRLYSELGKAYFNNHKDDEQPQYEQINSIRNAYKEIEQLKSEIDNIRGVKRCPSCGKTVAADVKFCDKCGTKFEENADIPKDIPSEND